MNSRSYIYATIGILLFQKLSSATICFSGDEFIAAQIILFYSPLESELIKGQISIYWNVHNFVQSDILNLYYGHPDLNEIMPIFSYEPASKKGVIKTNISPSNAYYNVDLTFSEQCTGYYGAWIRNGTIRKMSCLSTHPDWMSKYKSLLENMTLSRLFIPGTHHSGSYSEELKQTFIQRYTVTQSSDVLDQLISGVRYLDLRPCIIGNEYWICHGKFSTQHLDPIIDDIKSFIAHTQEIVIVTFKEFSRGFISIENHKKFMAYLIEQCEDFLAPRPSGFMRHVTLGELWKSEKRLIFSYNLEEPMPILLWPEIIQEWGNAQTIDELEHFIANRQALVLNIYLRTNDIYMRATMAELTLDTTDIIIDGALYSFGGGQKSLRQLGVTISEHITRWYNEKYFPLANIIAVDFVDATGIVETAIYWNLQRASNCFIHLII